MPEEHLRREELNLPHNIRLADPMFYKPAPVDMLIGPGTSLSLLCVGQIKTMTENLTTFIIQKTLLGWIIGGNSPIISELQYAKCHLMKLQNDMERFWELEEPVLIKHQSREELVCEEHFSQHVSRDENGRYIVALPFNEKCGLIGESRATAMKRLLSLQKRFDKDPQFHSAYKNIIKEYIELGHMKKIDDLEDGGSFLPHHAVTKESSLTTKIRVVFDGSARSSSGLSLNDALMSGPPIQDNIFVLLLRFRSYRYVLTGDIEKMYRQILLKPEDQKFQHILWKEDDGSISTYELTTVTFGLTSAPYLAIRCLHQLADDEKVNYPLAAKILKRDMYVDDLLTGANTVEEIVNLRDEMRNLLKSGCFNLRQCASNVSAVLADLPDSVVNLQLQNKSESILKTLGVYWDSKRDAIIYTSKILPISIKTTKRAIFSEIARIYDPLGLVNPVVVKIKLLIQELWRLKIDWDESLPSNLHSDWNLFKSQLHLLDEVSFPRHIFSKNDVQLHSFCDASERAYGACIYIRSVDKDNQTFVKLLCAKSRVAPLKTRQTLPRLELCSAVLLAHLYMTVKESCTTFISKTFFWTDSMITLHWINTSPHLLKTFVANRVSSIQMKTNSADWRHVRSQDNPADCVSRGLLPGEFIKTSIWQGGPKWLSGGEQYWPANPIVKLNETPEIRKLTCLTSVTTDDSILSRYSSFNKLKRIIAYCLRFKPFNRFKGNLTNEELQLSTIRIIKILQKKCWYDEVQALKNKISLPIKSKLLSLAPFLDKDGLIRVGGRTQEAMLSYQHKHPILLPKGHYITELLINQYHIDNLHSGIQATLYAMRQKYWPINGRNQIRKIIRSCYRCSRISPMPVEYPMANLPKMRVTESCPFTHVGVDYCGPFYIKEKRYRSQKRLKVYVAIFICLCVKAVHIEVVSDLTTESFLAALKRFISRRGKCSFIYSDNATNFAGAKNELQELYHLNNSNDHQKRVINFSLNKGIQWRFIPPQSPHVGGIWEAAVKSFKHHFKRVVGNEPLLFEQLNTLSIEIEAILNSRPLTPLSSDPNDITALTPAHFLIGDTFTSFPDQDFTDISTNRLSLWQHIQKMKRDFWHRWHKEYLNELNIRQKWVKGQHVIKLNSIVLLRDDNLPPLQWRLGRVVEVFPGPDGVIRTVKVKTTSGYFQRNVKRLAPLPVEQ